MKILRIINSKIRYKLIIGFVFVSLFVGVVSFISLNTIKDIGEGYNLISTESMPLLKELNEMKFNCLRLISSASEFAFILAESKNMGIDSPLEQEDKLMQDSCTGCHSAFAQYEYLAEISLHEAESNINQIRNSGIQLHSSANEFVEAKRNGIIGTEAIEKKEKMEEAEMGFLNIINEAIDHTNERLLKEKSYLNEKISSSLQNILFFSVLTFLTSVFIGILISHSISKPIVKLTQLSDNFRKGNLDAKLDIKSFDEIGMLGKSYNEMASKIKQLISQLKAEIVLTKKAEKELVELNASKDKFFSIVAHDLKSPFNAIAGFSELLDEKVREKDYERIGEFAGIIHQSSFRAMDLLTNLMEWSQSQTGRMEFKPEYLKMEVLLNNTLLLFTDIALQKSIIISMNMDPNAQIYGDKDKMATILRNLISNAIKFTFPGGEIKLSCKVKQGEVIVSISDTGTGIPADAIDKLFRIDSDYSTPGTKNEKGTGLGLILCKEFVEKHGGKIWVESQEGKGSEFHFTIPNNLN